MQVEQTSLAGLSFDTIQDYASSDYGKAGQPIVVAAPKRSVVDLGRNADWQKPFEVAPGVLVLSGHGDGMHMLLGDEALCGATSTADTNGCSYGQTCRKARAVRRVVFAADLRGDIAFLLSCNSLNVAGQLGSPDISIARALIERGFRYVVGSARQIAFDDSQIRLIQNSLANGAPIRTIVAGLNALAGAEDGYVALAADQDGAERGNPTHLRPAETANTASEDPDRQPDSYAELEYVFSTLLSARRLATAHAIRPLEEVLRKQSALLEALRGVHVRQHWEDKRALSEIRDRIQSALNVGWSEAVSAGLLGGADSAFGDVLQSALIQGNGPNPRRSTSTQLHCDTCDGRIRLNRETLVGGHIIETEWCTGCGIRRISTAGQAAEATLEFPDTIQPRVLATARASFDNDGAAIVHWQVRDKSRNQPIKESHQACTSSQLSAHFRIPDDAGPDIGSIRAVVFQGARLTYLRRVFRIEGRAA